MLTCFFIFLFLLHLFESNVFSLPGYFTGLAADWHIFFDIEFFFELGILDDLVLFKLEYDCEIVGPLLVFDSDILE